MNLYARLLKLLLKLFFSKKEKEPYDMCVLSFCAWPFDLDLNMHVNNARYLSWMDLGRIDLMGQTRLLPTMVKRKWLPIVAHAEIRYIKPIKPFNKIILQTQIEKIDEKYFHIKQSFFRNGQLMAIAKVKGLLIHKGKKIPPQEVLEAVENAKK